MADEKKPVVFWSNFMAMSSTYELCKDNTPRAEWMDIRGYVRADEFEELQSELTATKAALDVANERVALLESVPFAQARRIMTLESALKKNQQFWNCMAEFEDPSCCGEYAEIASDATDEALANSGSGKTEGSK